MRGPRGRKPRRGCVIISCSARRPPPKGPTMAVAELSTDRLTELLGDAADDLLGFSTPAVSKDMLHLPGPDFVQRVMETTDRNPQVLRNLWAIYSSGRL